MDYKKGDLIELITKEGGEAHTTLGKVIVDKGGGKLRVAIGKHTVIPWIANEHNTRKVYTSQADTADSNWDTTGATSA
jgi:hypothetical protein